MTVILYEYYDKRITFRCDGTNRLTFSPFRDEDWLDLLRPITGLQQYQDTLIIGTVDGIWQLSGLYGEPADTWRLSMITR